jgi:predicted transposase YbfD/YdcC
VVDKQGYTKRIADTIRGHWGIEVRLHWSLDVSFGEDRSRIRQGHSAQNLSLVRKVALNLLRHEPTVKRGIKTKRMKAGWDDGYLKSILKL